MPLLQAPVHPLQEFQRGAVDAPGRISLPEDQPGDRIHPQTVGMEDPQPVVGAGLQKRPDLAPGMHKVAAAPFALPYRGSGILVERGAVKGFQTVVIHRKMHRHKIQNDTNPLQVAGIDELHQLVGGAIPTGGRIKAGDLVPPAAVKGVLRQRHQLNMGIAVLLTVGGQLFGQLGIAVPTAVRLALPAAGMHFVDVQRPVKALGAPGHPFPVGKTRRRGGDDAAAVGAQGHGKPIGITVRHRAAVRPGDLILICHAGHCAGHFHFPNGGAGLAQVCPAEIPLHPDTAGRRRPHGKAGAVFCGMGAEKLVGIKGVAGIKILQFHHKLLLLCCNRIFSSVSKKIVPYPPVWYKHIFEHGV